MIVFGDNLPGAGSRGMHFIEIKPGMLMELHPQIWLPGGGGAMIGEMVAVTETGCDVLTRYPRDLQVW